MGIKIKVKVDMKNLLAAPNAVQTITTQSVKDIGQSLVATASGAAPHLTGVLDTSGKEQTKSTSNGAITEVSFHATRGGFDYARWTHDSVYNLGPGSIAKGGSSGMSGAFYEVGPKYLQRPLHGEAPTYAKYIEQKIQATIKALGG